MRNRLGVVVVVVVAAWAQLVGLTASAQEPAGRPAGQQPSAPAAERPRLPQPGSTQGAPTLEGDPVKKFDMNYFVGEWQFEGTLAETPLSPGGPSSGTETVANVMDGRFWQVTTRGEGDTLSGSGLIVYEDSFAGQFFTRYEVLGGVAILKTGTLGCDLGGVCNMYFETPSFEHKGMLLRLRGRYYMTSPVAYRMTMEISIDKGPYMNVGTTNYTKNEKVRVGAVK